jgi:hypothetical protein
VFGAEFHPLRPAFPRKDPRAEGTLYRENMSFPASGPAGCLGLCPAVNEVPAPSWPLSLPVPHLSLPRDRICEIWPQGRGTELQRVVPKVQWDQPENGFSKTHVKSDPLTSVPTRSLAFSDTGWFSCSGKVLFSEICNPQIPTKQRPGAETELGWATHHPLPLRLVRGRIHSSPTSLLRMVAKVMSAAAPFLRILSGF